MGDSVDIMTVSVKVNPALREYLLCINSGSDLIIPDYGDPLWTLVKSHLQLVPPSYSPQAPGPVPGHVRIALPTTSHGKPLYNHDKKAVVGNNYLFRNYLDTAAQRKVEHHLMKTFKDRFRHFMAGYLADHGEETDFQIKDAIDCFCRIYCMKMDAVTYEMLRKDWYRFRNRETPSEMSIEIKENM